LPAGPCIDLSLDYSALDGGKQRLAVFQEETDVLGALGRLIEHGDFLGRHHGAVIGGDLEQDADTHENLRCWKQRASFPQGPEWKT
tara:strand:+ start:1276 stop:1533 length:258 start_codon:yes stop_codon:yes gene_type:complete